MVREIIKEGLGIVVFKNKEENTYGYMLDDTILMNNLPPLCRPMLIKSFNELYKIREKESNNND